MAKIKNLKVKVAYTVWFEDVEVSDAVAKSMKAMHHHGLTTSDYPLPRLLEDSFDWIADNIKQDDAIEFEMVIEEL